MFSNRGHFEKSVKNVVAKANLALASTLSIIRTTKFKISLNKINFLFYSLVVSIISHGSPVWSLKYLNVLEKIQCRFLKKLLNLSKNTPDYAVRLETGRPHLALHIFKLTLNWVVKVLNMNSARYPQKYVI